jgi:hypothetical protein
MSDIATGKDADFSEERLIFGCRIEVSIHQAGLELETDGPRASIEAPRFKPFGQELGFRLQAPPEGEKIPPTKSAFQDLNAHFVYFGAFPGFSSS